MFRSISFHSAQSTSPSFTYLPYLFFHKQDNHLTHPFYLKDHIQFTNIFGKLLKMVQGLPAVDWKMPDNNTKLFAAVLTLFPGTPDHKKIAAVFGKSTSNPTIPIAPRPWKQSINFFA